MSADNHSDRFDSQPLLERFERACELERESALEELLEEVPASVQPAVFEQLLAIQIRHWSRRGAPYSQQELVQRFPQFAERILRLHRREAVTRQPGDWETRIMSDDEGADVPSLPPLPPVDETTRWFGDYELLEKLGVGGMGIVFRARQLAPRREVALKLIRADQVDDQSRDSRAAAIERFETEVQAAARLNHEGIVTVYEVGQVEGRHFFSMQLVDGPSLTCCSAKARSTVVGRPAMPLRSPAPFMSLTSRGSFTET